MSFASRPDKRARQILPVVWPVFLCVSLLIEGCQTPTPTPSLPQVTPILLTPIPALPIDDRIRESYRQADPSARKESVLRVTEAFLRIPAIEALSDQDASIYYTKVAFSSERMTFSDPAFFRRHDSLVVAGLPDGMGIYLYDLGSASDMAPLLLSQWTVGLSAIEVVWRREEVGVSYLTVGNDGMTRLHFVLVSQRQDDWQVAWFSDEEPDWWFNVYDATISINNDLSQLVVIGKALDTTQVFFEDAGIDPFPLRDFKVSWIREEDHYYMQPAPALYPSREEWLWDIALQSAYATLVEFLERLRMAPSNEDDMLPLVTGPEVIVAARDFGLYLPERRFTLVVFDQNIVAFRDRRGSMVVTFLAPSSAGENWRISSILPLGADSGGSNNNQPTPTP